jgi:hypothetical protein
MSYSLHIGDQLQADDELIDLLKRKNYEFILRFLDANYRFIFCTEQSGAAFDSCIDWCAQNAGNLEDAKQALVWLFGTFYPDLPPPVKDNLAYLAEDIGYDPSKSTSSKPKWLYRKLIAFGTTGVAYMILQGRKYPAALRVRPGLFRERWAYFRQSLEQRVSYIRAPFREPAPKASLPFFSVVGGGSRLETPDS